MPKYYPPKKVPCPVGRSGLLPSTWMGPKIHISNDISISSAVLAQLTRVVSMLDSGAEGPGFKLES